MAARTSNRRRPGSRARLVGAVALAVALSIGPTTAASATAPVTLGVGFVTDDADVLAPEQERAADDALRTLSEADGVDLYVVLLDRPTDPANIREWADAVAARNDLRANEYVLAIAMGTGEYYVSADDSGPLSPEALERIEADIRAPLGARDVVGAIETAAATAAAGETATGAESGGGGVLTLVLVIVVVAVGVVLAVVLLRRRRTRAAAAPPIEELARTAASALVETDDAVRASEQELGFAVAQFGEAATAEFAAALASARQRLDQAFTVQQSLDDATPETAEQTRAGYTQIVELCRAATDGLDERSRAFDELRRLEADAPAALDRVRTERDAAAAGIDAAAATLQTLRGAYAAEALATVDDNVDQARARLAFADERREAAASALAAGDGGEAAVAIRAAQEAVAQASGLEQAIDTLGTDLAAAVAQAHTLVGALEDDIRVAGTLADPDGRVAAAIAETRARVDAARADLSGPARHPTRTLSSLQEADRGIDAVVRSARDAAGRRERAIQQLDAQIAQARAQIAAAEGFVSARRGAVGVEARTRLAEAGAALARAEQLRPSAPEQALGDAQRANDLAGQAVQYARTDVGGFSAPAGGGGGAGFLGAMLGGIVGDALLGGGSSRRPSGFGGFGGATRSGGFGAGRGGGRSGGGSRGRRGGGRF